MAERTDQRICIKFCFNLGKSCTETIEMIQKAFVDESIGITQIKEWYRRFKNARTSVDSDTRSGRPSLATTPENIERVLLAIEGDRRLTVGELENHFGIPKTTAWEILKKISGMTRVCAVTGFFTMIMRQRIHRTLCSNFGVIQDCTASPASVLSRHSSLRLLDVPKIENGAQRKAVQRHRDDSE